MEKARKFILKIFRLLMYPELRILPGQLAFFLVMTIMPYTIHFIRVFVITFVITRTVLFIIVNAFIAIIFIGRM